MFLSVHDIKKKDVHSSKAAIEITIYTPII